MLDTRAQDHEIKAHALWAAGQVKALIGAMGRTEKAPTKKLCFAGGNRKFTRLKTELEISLDFMAMEYHATPCADSVNLSGRIARMFDPAWWTKNVRRENVKRNEVIEHSAGKIRRRGECYASDHAHKVKGARAKANRLTLEGMEVVNEIGQAFNLLEIADKSVSNPKIRRGELMTRARGFEEAAEFMGHKAIFLTITCPSRFHRWSGAGKENKNWTGDTPRDAQDYLCKTWAKIRAAWNRKGYTPYGFRVAEPHHDGCPHWHILLFVPGELAGWFEPTRAVAKGRTCYRQGAGIIGIAGRYALMDSPGEPGAFDHRFTCEHIDTTKGSATGYIAKYIAKNIDGLKEAMVIDGVEQPAESMGLDFASGTSAEKASARVKTWATTWGIRQFQQIGGPSVTVWREFRRLGEVGEKAQRDLFDSVQDAADQANWMMFWVLQGGPAVSRADLTMRPFYQAGSLGKYGDEVKRIKGITQTVPGGELYLQTRIHEWTVQRAGQEVTEQHYTERREDVKTAQNVARFLSAANDFGIEFSAHRAAWTGVNNCTVNPDRIVDTTANPFDFTGFEPGGGEIPYLPEYSRAGEPAEVAAEVAILEDLWTQTQYVYQRTSFAA